MTFYLWANDACILYRQQILMKKTFIFHRLFMWFMAIHFHTRTKFSKKSTFQIKHYPNGLLNYEFMQCFGVQLQQTIRISWRESNSSFIYVKQIKHILFSLIVYTVQHIWIFSPHASFFLNFEWISRWLYFNE